MIAGDEVTSPLIPAGYRVVIQGESFAPLRRNAQGEYEYISKYWYPFRYTTFAGALKRIRTDMYEQGTDAPADPLDMYQI